MVSSQWAVTRDCIGIRVLTMRVTGEKKGIKAKAYAGTTGVLLAMNLTSAPRRNLLGFAIERKRPARPAEWLTGLLRFPHQVDGTLTPIESRYAPIQKFRWSDYLVRPSTDYEYTIWGAYGDPENLTMREGPSLNVTTESNESGPYQIVFNRSVASSQAFVRRYPEIDLSDPGLDPQVRNRALHWLSGGLKEKILDFIDRAEDDNWALDVAIYEIELADIVERLLEALQEGVRVRIVYHAKSKDRQKKENEEALQPFPDAVKRPRKTSAIHHHKFIILSRVDDNDNRTPVAVLTGSTNFTLNGVFLQSNVVHVVENRDIVFEYLRLFEILFEGNTVAETQEYIQANDRLARTKQQVVFSPRRKFHDLWKIRSFLCKAKRDIVFCTTFRLDPLIMSPLMPCKTDRVLRYGLQNSRSTVTGYHRHSIYVAPAIIKKDSVEGFLRENTAGRKRLIYVHLKAIVCDFTSDSPTVISGSHNFSAAASSKNDENMLIIQGDTRVADTYVCEMMRLYDHYRFRYYVASRKGKGGPMKLDLSVDNSWTNPYFMRGSFKRLERIRFCGG